MVTLKLQSGTAFEPTAFAAFVDSQPDLAPRWRPTFVRIAHDVATTHTNKILKRVLRREKFLIDRIADPVYWRPRGASQFRRLTGTDLAELRRRFERAGHAERLEE